MWADMAYSRFILCTHKSQPETPDKLLETHELTNNISNVNLCAHKSLSGIADKLLEMRELTNNISNVNSDAHKSLPEILGMVSP